MYLISLQNSSEIIRLICDGKKFSGRSPPPCPSFLSNYEGQGGKIMSHKNKIPDFGKIYPQASEEVIKVLYQTERKIHYQEYDLKAGNYKISREEEKVTYIPSREDSLKRLLEADYQFTKEQLSVEDEAIRSMMYEKLYKNICLYNADIATCSYVLEYEDNNIKTTELEEQLLELFEKKNQKMLLKNFLNRELYFSGPCDKLYRMSIFENIRFPENQFYEDNYIALELMLKAEKIAVGNGKYYHYRQHINSTTKSYSDKKYHDAISAEMHNIKIVERFYPELVKFAHAPLYLRYFQFLDLLIFDSYSNIKAIQLIRSNIQNNIKNIILLENLNIKEKIALTMMAVNLVLYKMVRSLQKKSRGY